MDDEALAREPVYRSDGERFVPGPDAAGPWFPGVQHGGAVTALVARAVERLPAAQPMQLTRLTLDLSRRVPMAPLTVDAEVVRDGLRLQAVAVAVRHDGDVVARATALRLRLGDGVLDPADVPAPWPEDAPPPPPEAGEPWCVGVAEHDFVRNFEARSIGPVGGGRGTIWMRFVPCLVDEEPVTPTVRLAAAADFVLSAATLVGPAYATVNADLTLHVQRLPDGPWTAMQSVARVDAHGVGQSEGVVSDRRGRIARSCKSVLADRR